MKLSLTVTYAVHAALRLAAHRGAAPVSCSRLAASGGMPERFLLQILRDLTKQGILQSTRGGGGGFALARDPAEISLLDLIEAVEGPILAGLPAGPAFPPPCADRLREALGRVAETTRRQLAAVKLAHLIAPTQGGNGEGNGQGGQVPAEGRVPPHTAALGHHGHAACPVPSFAQHVPLGAIVAQ